MKNLLICTIAMFIGFSSHAQVEEEIDFKYLKAKYLVDTERYEEAIDAFKDIVTEDPTFKDAILLGAKAKYMMAAFTGTKNDVLTHIDNNGVTEAAIVLLGKADFRLQKYDAALNSLLIAAQLSTDDNQVYEYIGDIYRKKGDSKTACEYWHKAIQRGSSKANINVQRECDGVATAPKNDVPVVTTRPEIKDNRVPDKDSGTIDPSSTGNTGGVIKGKASDVVVVRKNEDTNTGSDTGSTTSSTTDNTGSGSSTTNSNMPPDDVYPNVIKVDDELSLTIYGQGLGRRKVMSQPNILILSDSDGTVAVDICVNSRGKVESAELNNAESTLKKEHLVSLALRKAKDFWFEVSDYKEQCGVIVFDIKSL